MSMPRLHWGSRGTAPLIPYIGAIWRWVENFKIPPLYHTETTRYQLVELQNHSGNYCRRDRGMRRHCATSRKVAGSIPDGAIGIFTLTWSFRPHYGSGVDLASNKNEYREYFLGVKAGGVESWKPYHLNVLIVLKSGTLNFLEPSGPVQGLLCLFFFIVEEKYILHLPRYKARIIHSVVWPPNRLSYPGSLHYNTRKIFWKCFQCG